MFRYLTLLLAGALVAGCGSTESDPLLRNAPYADLTDSIRQWPRKADYYYRRGQLLFQNNEKDYAKKDLRQAWKLEQREDIALSLASALRNESDDSAFVFLQQAREALPESLPLAVGLARGYQQKKRLDAALELCENILKVYPNQLDALSLKADLLQGQGKDAQALATLEAAYNYAPGDAELAHNLAFALAQAGHPRALRLADSLIGADRQGIHAEPYFFKALYYETVNRNEEALRLLDEAIRRDYTFFDAHMEKGELQYRQKQYAEALRTFERVQTISPTYADAYYWMGRCQEALGLKAEARLNYQRALGLDKEHEPAKAKVKEPGG